MKDKNVNSQTIFKALLIGFTLMIIVLIVVISLPHPSATTFFVLRVLLALSCALVIPIVPGVLHINLNNWLVASGALAVFVIVLLFNPPALPIVTALGLIA